jgi:PTS system glucitol/sorbitol-specific IIA component
LRLPALLRWISAGLLVMIGLSGILCRMIPEKDEGRLKKYTATVLHVGALVSEFTEAGILVFFGESAPQELYEFSVIHDGKSLEADLVPGDRIFLDGEPFVILAVGEVANTNFRNLGHLVMKFNGETQVEMPGDVCVEKKQLVWLHPGSKIEIIGEEIA